MAKETKESTKEVIAEVEEENKTMTIAEKIQKELNQAKEVEAAAAKKMAELEKLSNISDDVIVIVDGVASLDKDIAEQKAIFTESVKPFNEGIAAEKTKFDAATKELIEARTIEYNKVVESVGETGAKMLTGKVTSTGTGTGRGRGRSGNTRAQVIAAICDDGLSFEQAAEKYDHMGDGERAGSQKVGNLVKRHIDLEVKAGGVIKNDDGTYSRA